jgi:hypothetical protein
MFELPVYIVLDTPIFFVWLIVTLVLVVILAVIYWFSRGLPWTLMKTKIHGGGALGFVVRPDRSIAVKEAKVEGDSWFINGYGRFLTNRKTTLLMQDFPGRIAIFLSSMSFAQNPRVSKALEKLKGKGYQNVNEVIQGTANYIKEFRKQVLDQHLAMFQQRARAKGEEEPSELPPEYINYLDKQGLLTPKDVNGKSPLIAASKVPIDPPVEYDGWSVDINEISDWVKDYITPQQMENIVKKTRADVTNDILQDLPGTPKQGSHKTLLIIMVALLGVGVVMLILMKTGALSGIIPGL